MITEKQGEKFVYFIFHDVPLFSWLDQPFSSFRPYSHCISYVPQALIGTRYPPYWVCFSKQPPDGKIFRYPHEREQFQNEIQKKTQLLPITLLDM
jgi:hypothetical protein